MSIMSDRDLDMREDPLWDYGPGPENEDVFTGLAPTYIALAAEAAVVALFIGMVAVWAAIGAGSI